MQQQIFITSSSAGFHWQNKNRPIITDCLCLALGYKERKKRWQFTASALKSLAAERETYMQARKWDLRISLKHLVYFESKIKLFFIYTFSFKFRNIFI